nr:glycosyltransferase [Mucilaginibacter sp. PPCGB 2223]
MTDSLGESQVISYLKELSKKGFKFTIISFEKKKAFEQKKHAIQKITDECNILWCPAMYTKKPPVISTLFDLWKMKKMAAALEKEHQYDVVHCRSYIAAMAGLYLKKITKGKIKFIFDMRGFWIEERVEGGMWDLKKPLFKIVYSFFKSQEQKFYQQSDKIVSLTDAGKGYIVKAEGINEKKIGVVPTCVDFELFKLTDLQQRNDLKKQLKIDADAKVFVYAGAVGGSYTTDLILKVYYYYKLYFKHTHLLLLAKDSLNADSLVTLDELEIKPDEITIIQSPFREVYRYLNIGSLGYVFYAKGWSNIARSPTKMGEYLACGLPTLVYGDIGDVNKLKNDLEIFITGDISQGSCFGLFAEIEKSTKAPQIMRSEAYEYCSLEKGVKFYDNIYHELMGETV